MDPSNLVELVGMRRLYPLDFSPYSPPDHPAPVRDIHDAIDRLAIVRPRHCGPRVVRRRKRAGVAFKLSSAPLRLPEADMLLHVDHGPLPAVPAIRRCRRAHGQRRRARRADCIGRGHVVRPSNRRHHRTVGVIAWILSLVDGRRSSASTRDCTGR